MPRSQATKVWFPGITASYSGGPIFWWKGHQITCLHCGCINLILYESLELTIYSITADGSYSAMSNLALKGITGIYAMGKINQLLEGRVYGADTNRTSYYLASFSYSFTDSRFAHVLNPYYCGTRKSNWFQCRKRHRIMRNDGGTSLCLHKAIVSCRSSGTPRHGGSCTISTLWNWLGPIYFLKRSIFLNHSGLNQAFTSFSQVYGLQASLYNGISTTGEEGTSLVLWRFWADVPEALPGVCPVRYESRDNSSKIRTSRVHNSPIIINTDEYLPDWSLLAAGSLFQDTTGARDAIIKDIHDFTFMRSFGPNPSTCSLPASRYILLGAASAANGAAFVLHALR